MITTREYENIQATLVHRITGKIGIEEAKTGISEAVNILQIAIKTVGKFNLIIDTKGLSFTDLIAHKIWSQGLHCHGIREQVNYLVFIMDDSQYSRMKKEQMETETLKAFFDFDEGINWLRHKMGF